MGHTNTVIDQAFTEEEEQEELRGQAAALTADGDGIDEMYRSVVNNPKISIADKREALKRYTKIKRQQNRRRRSDAVRAKWSVSREANRESLKAANMTRRFLVKKISEYRRQGMSAQEAQALAEKDARAVGHDVGEARRSLRSPSGSAATLTRPRGTLDAGKQASGGTTTGVDGRPLQIPGRDIQPFVGPPAPGGRPAIEGVPQHLAGAMGPPAPPAVRGPGIGAGDEDVATRAVISMMQNMDTIGVDKLIANTHPNDPQAAKYLYKLSTMGAGNKHGKGQYSKLIQRDQEEAARRKAQAQGGVMPF